MIAAVQKYANLVELEKCCQTHIFLQKFVLIQPRKSPFKIFKILQNLKFANFWRARSRLYQNEILQENMRLTAFFKLYKMCTLLHRCDLKILAKNRFEKSATFVKKLSSTHPDDSPRLSSFGKKKQVWSVFGCTGSDCHQSLLALMK